MFTTLKAVFQDKDVRSRILFTLGMLIVFRLGTHITVPGVNAQAINTLVNSGLFGLLNTFGGGALHNYSIFSLGVSPYITAQIVVQLLQMDIVPAFTEWSKQGEVGRRKLNKWTRYLSVLVSFFQAIAISVGFNSLSQFGLIKDPGMLTYCIIALVMTAGSMLVVWIGEQITQFGIGNGVSLIIFSGIVARIPGEVLTAVKKGLIDVTDQAQLTQNAIFGGIFALVALLLIILVVYVNQAERRIPVRYSKRASTVVEQSHMPLKINSAGVIPVIFASSIIMVPQTVLSLLSAQFSDAAWFKTAETVFNLEQPIGMTIYAVTIVLFTFFYAHIQINPERVAENFQKSGAYIPSVRPGLPTERYISKMLNRLSSVGSLFLMMIAILPLMGSYFFDLPRTIGLGGTSLLIVVGVALDTAKQIEGRLIKRRYVGFIR
ncbi:preprotein translocase subunit SecY [Aerococcus sanguinicola]|uniref:Protein translocase subunit SecY n=1 Tax=Aerococcus sanguinicola TaxID=119206 RepID=A0A0X8FAK9_9LACT|nr:MULTISPECIES: preprotein translocase subunit SecY [Aerococcus]AMB93812.1 preprotein translocase subunit SecY [Aerococcus sanguinicola]KAB0646349.1 preprotein translocase subunit SecY [Aerococcus sanguinicola]MDK6233672.1 preprotein translocase subunit SecY [Aerococcus sp. UMB10185]MDK6805549.1 preprotein translocase subunit SecY [Aerococcus sp. UMB7834]MDK6855973.1 preprotein translocase subunit SecY [Aerococcus sp. UMB7533]